MRTKRRRCREVKIGNIRIGGSNPVAVQSMVKTFTSDLPATLKEIKALQIAGCQIVRLAVRNNEDAITLKKIKKQVAIPLVADIHFDKNLALKAIESGVDKIRLNPGNIYRKKEVREIAKAAKQARIPIRVGVNSGSLRVMGHRSWAGKRTQDARIGTTQDAEKMVNCALDYIKLLEDTGFNDIVVSIKGSDIFNTIQANERVAKSCDYPLHLGVTASGRSLMGAIKSCIAIGRLLLEGIGDTIRISLTEGAVREVEAAFCILESLGLSHSRPQIISCPTCGRCEVDLIKIVKELEKRLYTLNFTLYTPPPKVAVMGCMVNGPGEARAADVGVAFGRKEGLLFRKGKPIKKIPSSKCVDVLLEEISKCVRV